MHLHHHWRINRTTNTEGVIFRELTAVGFLLEVSFGSLSVACQQMAALLDLDRGSTLFAYHISL